MSGGMGVGYLAGLGRGTAFRILDARQACGQLSVDRDDRTAPAFSVTLFSPDLALGSPRGTTATPLLLCGGGGTELRAGFPPAVHRAAGLEHPDPQS
jgi:hypothetical protein